ncbi:hypothetical protein D3C74_248120 [compost metagenome]
MTDPVHNGVLDERLQTQLRHQRKDDFVLQRVSDLEPVIVTNLLNMHIGLHQLDFVLQMHQILFRIQAGLQQFAQG